MKATAESGQLLSARDDFQWLGLGILSDVFDSSCGPIIIFYNLLVYPLEAYVDLGQIAKLSPDTLAWCAEFGSSDLVAGLQCCCHVSPNVLPGTFDLSGEVTSEFCCQMSPVVLSEYLQFVWGSYICILLWWGPD